MVDAPTDSIAFPTVRDLDEWLLEHHARTRELWVRIYKVGSGRPSVTWEECVLSALTVGWIDGQRRALDAHAYLQRLTPRAPRSLWSARNRAHALHLIAEGRMQAGGLAAIEAARRNGRWDNAYAGSADTVVPADLRAAVADRPAAAAHLAALDRATLYGLCHQLETAARPETRARRLSRILAGLERGEPPRGR